MVDTDQLKTMICGLTSKTLYGQHEPLMPEIDRKIREGVSRADIHQLITARGIEISAGTFYNYLYRYRKRNSISAPPCKTGNYPKPALVQDGNFELTVVEPETESSTVRAYKPAPADILSNENSREEFANQFMARPPLFRKRNT